MGSGSSIRALGLSVCLLAIACGVGTRVEVPSEPVAQTIALNGEETHSLIFQKVMFRIVNGTIIGEARMRGRVIDEIRWNRSMRESREFNVAITDALRERGYDARDSADALFDSSSSVKVRYEMAAILHEVNLDFEYAYDRRHDRTGEGAGTADVKVEVLLHDSVDKKIVYSRTFTRAGVDRGLEPNPIIAAVVDGVLKSTTDPAFVKIVSKSDHDPSDPDSVGEVVEIPACPESVGSTLPEALSEILESVVEIQVGSSGGTGVIISPDGWILTAAHVVDGASEVWARLASGPQIPATVHRIDPRMDVALLHVVGRGFACAELRESDLDLDLGSDVFTINMALGQGAVRPSRAAS